MNITTISGLERPIDPEKPTEVITDNALDEIIRTKARYMYRREFLMMALEIKYTRARIASLSEDELIPIPLVVPRKIP